MIKISWQSRDITWLSTKKTVCLVSPSRRREPSRNAKISIIANRVGEGLASRLPARTRIIVVLWWAPDTSLLSLRESLPLDSSLSLSLVPLSRLASARFTRNFVTSTRLRIEQLRFDDRSLESRFPRVYQFYRQIGERWFVVEILRVPRNTRRILFLYSHFDIFGSQRDFQSGNSRCRCSEVPRGRPRNFLLYFNLERNVPFVERKKKTFFGARLLKEEERRRRRRTLSYDSNKFKDLGIKSRSRIIFSKQISITERI